MKEGAFLGKNNHHLAKKLSSAFLILCLLLIIAHSTYVFSASETGTSKGLVKLRILETTDVHTNIMSFDYKLALPNQKVGLAKTATLVKKARQEVENNILVDNGDLIQGTALGTYKAIISPLTSTEVHPMIKVLNIMDYDIATLGNHEFNYGLDFLKEVYNDATFPYVNANVYIDDHDNNPNNDKNKFQPYKIMKKKVVDENGKKQVINIGYIGFLPPQANVWDKANLEGKVIVKGILDTAKKFIPEMKKQGTDIVIALVHSGFSSDKSDPNNVVYALSEVPGIDAITFSHTHKQFPAKSLAMLDGTFQGKDKKPLPGIDNEKGTINGIPAVQAGSGGGSLGIIDLSLKRENGKWRVVDSKTFTREIWQDQLDPVSGKMKTSSMVEPDPKITKLIYPEHMATIKYMEAAKNDISHQSKVKKKSFTKK